MTAPPTEPTPRVTLGYRHIQAGSASTTMSNGVNQVHTVTVERDERERHRRQYPHGTLAIRSRLM